MDVVSLESRPRALLGKKCRYLRRSGITPANLYGAGVESIAIQIDSRALQQVMATTSRNTPVQISILGEAEPRTAFIWKTQRDPITDQVLHIDLYHVEATRRMRADVPLVLVGVDPDLEKLDKRVTQFINSVSVETLPLDLPTSFEVDCSALNEIDDEVRLASVAISDKVTLLTDPEGVIARVTVITVLAEPEPEEEEGEAAAPGEEAAPAEGAAAPVDSSASESAEG